jgi:hypothetical protein
VKCRGLAWDGYIASVGNTYKDYVEEFVNKYLSKKIHIHEGDWRTLT